MIVLDCSAALEIAKSTKKGLAYWKMMDPAEEVIAPSLFTTEVANAAWKHVHAGVLDTAAAMQLMQDALAIPDRLVPAEQLLVEAFAEGTALGCGVYDMVYLVLARRKAATLLTCDERLQDRCAKRAVSCVVEVLMES